MAHQAWNDELPPGVKIKTNALGKNNESEGSSESSREKRWGFDGMIFQFGYSIVPNFFLRNYAHLNPSLSTAEAMFVLQLMTHKWGEDSPFPAYKTIATNMKVSVKMVRRYAQKVEAKGYLIRVPRPHASNKFDLQGLFYALRQISLGKRQNAIKDKAAAHASRVNVR